MSVQRDEGIVAVRRIRESISREFDNDPGRLVAHYMQLQAAFRGKLIPGPDDSIARHDAAANGTAPHR